MIGTLLRIFGTPPQINHNFLRRYPVDFNAERQKYIFGRHLDQVPAESDAAQIDTDLNILLLKGADCITTAGDG